MNRTLVIVIGTVLALIATATAGAWFTERYADAQRRAKEATQLAASLRSQLDSTEASIVKVTEYVDRVQKVYVQGETIVKEIPRYVTDQADASCTIPVGFVRLHDAAATGAMLGPNPGDPDAPAAGVSLSTVAGTVAGNYTAGHANAEQLKALQATLRAQGVTIIGEATSP